MSLTGRTPGRWTITGNFRAQFGLAVSLGMMIGIVPKDSLIPWGTALLALVLPVNLGTTLVAIVIGSLLSMTMDSFAHVIGNVVLSNATVLSFMTQLTELPLFAWTRLNNTVVMGLTTIGILMSIPTYLAAYAIYRHPRIWPNSDIERHLEITNDFPVVHTPNLQES